MIYLFTIKNTFKNSSSHFFYKRGDIYIHICVKDDDGDGAYYKDDDYKDDANVFTNIKKFVYVLPNELNISYIDTIEDFSDEFYLSEVNRYIEKIIFDKL